MKMQRLVTMALGVGLAVFSASPASAQTATCGTAVLQDVEVVTGRVPQPTITSVRKKSDKPGERDVNVFTTPSERQTKSYLVTVRLNDLVYVGESSANGFWSFDPTRLVINDPIHACVSKGTLSLRKPDGKDYKTKIVRIVRNGVREP
jgi:hypothetical protein